MITIRRFILYFETGVYELLDFGTHRLDSLPLGVLVGTVMEAVGNRHAAMMGYVVLACMLERHGGQDCVISAYVDGVERIGGCNHLLVELLARTDTHLHLRK